MRLCGWVAVVACALLGTSPHALSGDGVQQVPQHRVVADADWSTVTEITVELHDNTYEPHQLTLKVGHPYIITLKNVGKVSHDMVGGTLFRQDVIALRMVSSKVGRITADSINSVYIRPKQEAEIWFVPIKTGSYSFICTIPGHREDGMEGDVRIVD